MQKANANSDYNRRDSNILKDVHNNSMAQFLHLPVDLVDTVAAEHTTGAAQNMDLVVGALSEGERVVVLALTALNLDLNLDNVLALLSNLTHQNRHALLTLGLGMGTLNWSSTETEKFIFFKLSNARQLVCCDNSLFLENQGLLQFYNWTLELYH